MTDPCDSPGACRGTATQSGRNTRFEYTCPGLPPPKKFGLENYTINISPETKNLIGLDTTYNIQLNDGKSANGSSKGVRVSIETGSNSFRDYVVDNPNAYAATIDYEENALIISTVNGFAPNSVKAGVTWRIGSEVTRFTSCLLLLTAFCNSTVNIPLIGAGTFTFSCPDLPNPRLFGLFGYGLRLDFIRGVYSLYTQLDQVEPNTIVGTFTYDGGFDNLTSENGFLLTSDDSLQIIFFYCKWRFNLGVNFSGEFIQRPYCCAGAT